MMMKKRKKNNRNDFVKSEKNIWKYGCAKNFFSVMPE